MTVQSSQRLEALEHANAIRIARAQLKRDLKAGRVLICDVLLEPPACLTTATVYDLLCVVPRYGPLAAMKVLSQCEVSPVKPIGALSERQRRLIVGKMEARRTA